MRPMPLLTRALALVALLLLPREAMAWTERTQEKVAENAALLMPASLRQILAAHRERLFAGAGSPRTQGGDADHFQNLDSGTGNLAATIEAQARRVLRVLNSRTPMSEVAYEMGVLSHFVADAQNPLNTSSREPREAEYAEDFELYVDRNLERFQMVFYGYGNAALDEGDYRKFATEILERSSRYYDWLVQDYLREGQLQSSETFSDFSFAFGAGTLAFSHGVADTASLWLYLWKSANGDCSNLPITRAPVRLLRD